MNTRTGNATLAGFQATGPLHKRRGRTDALLDEQTKFDELIRTHQPQVTRLVARLMAWPSDQAHIDDVVQEVFLSAWQHRSSYRGDSEVATWLSRIAINKARNYVRSRVTLGKLIETMKTLLNQANDSERDASGNFDQLHQAISRLKPRDREVIVLRYLEDHPVDEIANLLQIKRNTVDARLTRARRRLQHILAPTDN